MSYAVSEAHSASESLRLLKEFAGDRRARRKPRGARQGGFFDPSRMHGGRDEGVCGTPSSPLAATPLPGPFPVLWQSHTGSGGLTTSERGRPEVTLPLYAGSMRHSGGLPAAIRIRAVR